MSDDLRVVATRVRRGFAGFKLLLDQLSGRVDSLSSSQAVLQQQGEENRDELTALKERVARLEGHKEGVRDGREDTTRTFTEVNGIRKEVHEEKKIKVEGWKATAPIIVAVVTGIFGLIAGILALIQSYLRGGGAGGH